MMRLPPSLTKLADWDTRLQVVVLVLMVGAGLLMLLMENC